MDYLKHSKDHHQILYCTVTTQYDDVCVWEFHQATSATNLDMVILRSLTHTFFCTAVALERKTLNVRDQLDLVNVDVRTDSQRAGTVHKLHIISSII